MEQFPKKSVNSYLKYSGMAIQMGLTIAIGAYLGKWLDGYFETPKPFFTSAFALLFTAAALYLNLRDFLFDPKKNNNKS